jgi:23S rRNA (uracil1939-C5)-methyltransferase
MGIEKREGNTRGAIDMMKKLSESQPKIKPPFRTGQMLELQIDGLGHDGEGVGRAQGFTFFIPGAIPGDQVLAVVKQVKKNYGFAEVVKVISPSPDRVMPECSVFGRCGGCALQHMDYQAQLRWKRQRVVDALQRIGGFSDPVVHETIGMAQPFRYRNKGQYPVTLSGEQLVAGFYAKGSHEVVACQDCLIQHPLNNRIVSEVSRLAMEFGLDAYNEHTGQGFLRHILIKTGFETGEALCVLVTNGRDFPEGDGDAKDSKVDRNSRRSGAEFGRRLQQAVPELVGVVQNINTQKTNVILGDETRTLWGRDALIDELCGLQFKISARSFFQVNPLQTAVLYNKALEYAALNGTETVLDLYCGIGTISLLLAGRSRQVIGVEYVEDAVVDARNNAEMNGISNVDFYAGDAGTVLENLAGEGINFDVAVLDPPRAGCDAKVLRILANLKVPRIVYVSCNPASLARDLKLLAEMGYGLKEAQPVDMFPQTSHVETVVLMSRIKE